VSQLPKPPLNRRMWLGILAVTAVLSVAVAGAALGWNLGRPSVDPGADAAARSPSTVQNRTQATPPPTITSPRTTARPQQPGVLWQHVGSDLLFGSPFSAPRRWHIRWSFDCRNFAAYGGGNFKLSGGGDFKNVSLQRFGVGARGTVQVTGGGNGNLVIESVCQRWAVQAVAG
jgi:hypothetical protein